MILSIAPILAGTVEQASYYCRATAENDWFWANAFNTRDNRLKIAPAGDDAFRVNGISRSQYQTAAVT
jgi:hypothetical protein